MAHFLTLLQENNLLSTVVRLLLAAVLGGLIGTERGAKGRAAGMRTHIIVCIGAAMTALVGLYTTDVLGQSSDPMRLSAQVISGIGFLGGGMILIRGRHRITGLTTAAGLWASAIIGLTIGGGFYEGALLATALVFFAESVLSRLEYRMLDHVPEINLYMEYADKSSLEEVLRLFRENRVSLQDMEITRTSGNENHNACAIFSLRFSKGASVDDLLTQVTRIDGVVSVQEL